MTITEICLVLIALSAAVVGVAALVVVLRLVPLLRSVDQLLRDSTQTVSRINQAVGQVELMVHDVRRIEQKAAGILDPLLNQVVPPVRLASAILAGVRGGIVSLFRGKH